MTFTPERSEAVRSGLVELVHHHTRFRRGMAKLGLALAGAVAGAGVSVAAFAASDLWSAPPPTPSLGPVGSVTAPPGHVPGAPLVSLVAEPAPTPVTGPGNLPLSDVPTQATHLRLSFTCTGSGSFTISLSGDSNTQHVDCTEEYLRTGRPMSSVMDHVLLSRDYEVLVEATPEEAEGLLGITYLQVVPTELGVNRHGHTYGIPREGFRPDLVAVQGRSTEGRPVAGYVRASDLGAYSVFDPNRFIPDLLDPQHYWLAEDLALDGGREVPLLDEHERRIGTFGWHG